MELYRLCVCLEYLILMKYCSFLMMLVVSDEFIGDLWVVKTNNFGEIGQSYVVVRKIGSYNIHRGF